MRNDSIEALALEAIELARNSLLVHMRFMNVAVGRLRPLPIFGSSFATDGTWVRFDPETLAQRYAENPAYIVHDWLHVVLHAVFLHLYPKPSVDILRWDTACDIAVEHVIAQLAVPSAQTPQDSRRNALLASFTADMPIVTAETSYRVLCDKYQDDDEVRELRAAFIADDHSPWYAMIAQESNKGADNTSNSLEEQDTSRTQAATQAGKRGTDFEAPEEERATHKAHSSRRGLPEDEITTKETPENISRAIGGRFANTVNLDRSRDQWKNAAYEMGVALDTYVKLWGVEGSNLAMNLRSVTREKHDYREFLRKFARMGEHMRINNDEFDYVYYCYGLSLYQNLPLIEPLEFKEERRIRDFVVAIDTSASTKDGLVRAFIERTYSILSNETSFFTDMNIVIIQCDAEITDVTRISSLKELESYVDDIEIKGLGGTDFRPVFSYVDQMLDAGELNNLGGLIYFTDGQGSFPSHKPDYNAAFVFVEDDSGVQLPVWAMKVVLDEEILVDEEEVVPC